jgi:hypothetical protein
MSIFKTNLVESMKQTEAVKIQITRPDGSTVEAEGYISDLFFATGNPDYIESLSIHLHGPQGELTIKNEHPIH